MSPKTVVGTNKCDTEHFFRGDYLCIIHAHVNISRTTEIEYMETSDKIMDELLE